MWRKTFIISVVVFLLWIAATLFPVKVSAEENVASCGGINILKTDVFGNALSGAGFQIAREATRRELTDSSVTKRLLRVGGDMLTVVYDAFWNTREMTGKKQTEVITSDCGTAAVYGLPYGTYYLVESRPPEGYNAMPEPLRITINKYSHLTAEDNIRDDAGTVIDNTVHIITVRYSLSNGKNKASVYFIAVASLLSFLISLVVLSKIRKCRIR